MIELQLMYELYTEHINFSLKKLLNENLDYVNSFSILKKLLVPYENIIKRYSSYTLENILKSSDVSIINKLSFPYNSPIYIDGKQINFKVIRLYIEKILWCNSLKIKNDNKIQELKRELISFSLYYRIIVSFNKKIIDKIINKNYFFNIIPSFGGISVIRNYNERKRVNWGISNKNKQNLLDEGKLPYIKKEALEAIENKVEYKGIKWLEFHPFEDFYLHWHKKFIVKKYNPYLRDYVFKPARGKDSIVSKLQKVKKDRNRANLLYTITLD